MTPSGTLTGHRRARRLPAARRPRRLRRRRARPGRDRVQRHGLQRGEAARVRLRLRAGDEAAQAAERDQPEPVALRAGQRVHGHDARVRAEHARQRRRRRDHGRRHRPGDALAHARRAGDVRRVHARACAQTYTASTTANVDLDRRRRDADGHRPEREHDRLPGQRRVRPAAAAAGPRRRSKTYTRPGLQRRVPITFTPADRRDRRRCGPGRTAKTLTFTLSTTNP